MVCLRMRTGCVNARCVGGRVTVMRIRAERDATVTPLNMVCLRMWRMGVLLILTGVATVKFVRVRKAGTTRIMPRKAKPDPHAIVHVDEWAPGRKRLWCACGTRCRDGVKMTAEEVHQQHVRSQNA